MQTIERPTSAPRRGPRLPDALWVLAAAALVPILVLAVLSRTGALVAFLLAALCGLGIWVWKKGFVFVEIVAFLIHFDGLGMGPIRLGRLVAAVALCVLAYKLLSGWRPPAIPVRQWLFVWLFSVIAVVSGLWAAKPGGWFFTMAMLLLGIAYFFVSGLMVENRDAIERFLRAYWVGGLFGTGPGILALFLGTRSWGLGGDPNFFGLVQASLVPLTVYYRRNAPTVKMKWVYTVVLIYILAGAAGAGSRSGLIGGTVAIVATMVTRPGLNPVKRAGVGVGALFVGAFAFIVGYLANPANLQRGLNDRGAGRVDFWNITIELIKDNPIRGYGLGQIKSMVPPNLLLIPGSQWLHETRPDISTHNTWLDVQADLGAFGLLAFLSIIVMALLAFAYPRWLETRELSTTLFVMMLPVITGSFFLPLLNNKLAWVLVGLAAALQVPSASSRWPGWARATASKRRAMSPVLMRHGGAAASTELAVHGESPPPLRTSYSLPEAPLAKWDLGIGRRFVMVTAASALIAAFVAAVAVSFSAATYTATATFVVPDLDRPVAPGTVAFQRERLQGVLTAGVSSAYAAELAELADIDADIDTVRSRLDATRPNMGLGVQIAYTGSDRAEVERVNGQLRAAMHTVYSKAHDASIAQAENELRPLYPGESRLYTGPAFIDGYDVVDVAVNPPRVTWLVFVATIGAALLAAGIQLTAQRFPRLSADDDLPSQVGLSIWGRLRRPRVLSGPGVSEFSNVLNSVRDGLPARDRLDRILVSSARTDIAQMRLALGLAVALVNAGTRVVLVDGSPTRPLLSARLGVIGRVGMTELASGDADIASVMHRVRPGLLRGRFRVPSDAAELLRVVPAGRSRGAVSDLPVEVLDQFDDDIVVVFLGPPLTGSVPSSGPLEWADAVVLSVDVGRTRTADLDAAASELHLLAESPCGVVMVGG